MRNLEPKYRKCIFPDEPTGTAYRRYSYSTCVTECLKQAQIRICNCTHYNMIVDENDKSPECDFYGLGCLDNNDLLFPQTTIMQPWRTDGLVCTCLPSCNEPQINVVGRSSKIHENTAARSVSIRLQSIPTQRYYRQAVRETIDVVGINKFSLHFFVFNNVTISFYFSFGRRNIRAFHGSEHLEFL